MSTDATRTIDVPLATLARFADWRACALRVGDRIATFDVESECWQVIYRRSLELREQQIAAFNSRCASEEEIAAAAEREKLGGCGC